MKLIFKSDPRIHRRGLGLLREQVVSSTGAVRRLDRLPNLPSTYMKFFRGELRPGTIIGTKKEVDLAQKFSGL